MAIPNNIVFTADIQQAVAIFFAEYDYSKIAVLVDENTKRHCYPLVQGSIPEHVLLEIRSGEEQKNLDTCQQIWNSLTQHSFDRKSLLINLGGGVIGDMGGFCAATYKRGIDFINIPTTLLAQVDASIGGKLGIDFQNFKNHIGVFQDPLRVFLDPVFFKTLPANELRSGYAEVIKHCLIRDAAKFDEIRGIDYSELDLSAVTRHSVDIKQQVVENDPTEKGLRKILNFGHTIGHAIESYFLNDKKKKLLHGEAIAIGMICESYLSQAKLGLTAGDLDKISTYILKIYNKKSIDEREVGQLLELTRQDKKNEGNTIKCSLLNSIGDCTFNIDIDENDIRRSMDYYNALLTD